jgi:AGCS family alanine or glycine:cation symporter
MKQLMETICHINDFLWGAWTLYVLLGAGIVFTLWTKFSQFKVLTHGVAVTRGKYDNADDPGAINHFQALSAALSATIGLGNIGGVAVAIALGGPGALFWMWIVGFFGMALKAVEITLAMLYRNTEDPDDPHGGAMWVIHNTVGAKGGFSLVLAKTLGVTFCITMLIMTMAGGNMFQTWNVADLTLNYFGVPKIVTGIALAILVGLVIVGGIKRIGQVAARLVPIMCILYLLSSLAVLAVNVQEIPSMFALIFRCAFAKTEAAGAFLGGTFGFVFAQGMKRALFSNEAGLGSAPIAHAAAKTNEPAREGIVGGMGPFIDTICICSLTALVIISTGTWNRGPIGEMTGVVELVKNEGKVELVAPGNVSALPELPIGET